MKKSKLNISHTAEENVIPPFKIDGEAIEHPFAKFADAKIDEMTGSPIYEETPGVIITSALTVNGVDILRSIKDVEFKLVLLFSITIILFLIK